MTASPSLKDFLGDRIGESGPLAFSEFMEAALYHDTLGYYSDPARRIGRGGDFYTSVSVGPVFGELLAEFVAGVWEAAGRPSHWIVAEQGGHDGTLARDVLAALEGVNAGAAAATRWTFVEKRPAWCERQRMTLFSGGQGARATWVGAPDELPPETGLFLSNELVDALPVDLVRFLGGQWLEKRVGRDPGTGCFTWVEVPATEELRSAVDRLGLPHSEGMVGEVRRGAERWAGGLYSVLPEGVVLTMDYGDLAEELYGPSRPEGTLRAYAGHRQDTEVLADPGKKDLTAHVDFSLLMRQGEAGGWQTRGYLDQSRFLISLAARPGGWLSRQESAAMAGPRNPVSQAALRQFRTLTHPELMGRVFRVLIQARGRYASARLPGLDFLRAGEGAIP